MRKSFLPALAAAMLIPLSPVLAANPPPQDAATIQKDQGAAPPPQTSKGDDQTPTVIILDQNSLDALPNPYDNPGPRMISDIWAMRT